MNFKPLIEEFGIDKLPQEQQEAIFENIFKSLQARVSLRMAAELSDEQQRQLEEAAKHGDEAAMAELQKVYPNIAEVYQQEIDSLREDVRAILPQ